MKKIDSLASIEEVILENENSYDISGFGSTVFGLKKSPSKDEKD
jgi:hypothetical protein